MDGFSARIAMQQETKYGKDSPVRELLIEICD